MRVYFKGNKKEKSRFEISPNKSNSINKQNIADPFGRKTEFNTFQENRQNERIELFNTLPENGNLLKSSKVIKESSKKSSR